MKRAERAEARGNAGTKVEAAERLGRVAREARVVWMPWLATTRASLARPERTIAGDCMVSVCCVEEMRYTNRQRASC